MSIRRTVSRGTEARLKQIPDLLEAKDYYSAQQVYKSVFHRLAPTDEITATDILRQGAVAMLGQSELTCSSELCLMLCEHLSKSKIATTTAWSHEGGETVLDMVVGVCSKFTSASTELTRVLKAALEWSKTNGSFSSGEPILHGMLGACQWDMGDVANAQLHLARARADSQASKDWAVKLSKQAATGLPHEKPLFLGRAVLQCLCVQNLAAATALFTTFTAEHYKGLGGHPQECKALPDPLSNFLRFLILTCTKPQDQGAQLYKTLVSKYAPAIDPTFQGYLDHIAKEFFGIVAPKQMGIGDLLKGLLGGNDAQ